jgi:hypothetical protein
VKPITLLTLTLCAATLTPAAAPTPQQKAPPTTPSAQALLEERVKRLEDELSDQKQKLAAASMEKDYMERTSKDAKDYYDKVLTQQTAWLGIMALIITLIPGFAALFSFRVFNRHVARVVSGESRRLHRTITDRTKADLETLRNENAENLKILTEALTATVHRQVGSLDARALHGLLMSTGTTAMLQQDHATARKCYRSALEAYARRPDAFDPYAGKAAAWALFNAIRLSTPADLAGEIRNEIEQSRELYSQLDRELSAAAIDFTDFPELAAALRAFSN